MGDIVLLIITVFLCGGAIYRWVRYVEAVAEASITLKGDKLKEVLPTNHTTDG